MRFNAPTECDLQSQFRRSKSRAAISLVPLCKHIICDYQKQISENVNALTIHVFIYWISILERVH